MISREVLFSPHKATPPKNQQFATVKDLASIRNPVYEYTQAPRSPQIASNLKLLQIQQEEKRQREQSQKAEKQLETQEMLEKVAQFKQDHNLYLQKVRQDQVELSRYHQTDANLRKAIKNSQMRQQELENKKILDLSLIHI